jgi:hypothetical protein
MRKLRVSSEKVGMLAFEVAALMLRLWRALANAPLAWLRGEAIRLEGVHRLVTDDDVALLVLALTGVGGTCEALAACCADPLLHWFESLFVATSGGRHKLRYAVASTADLCHELDVLTELEEGGAVSRGTWCGSGCKWSASAWPRSGTGPSSPSAVVQITNLISEPSSPFFRQKPRTKNEPTQPKGKRGKKTTPWENHTEESSSSTQDLRLGVAAHVVSVPLPTLLRHDLEDALKDIDVARDPEHALMAEPELLLSLPKQLDEGPVTQVLGGDDKSLHLIADVHHEGAPRHVALPNGATVASFFHFLSSC